MEKKLFNRRSFLSINLIVFGALFLAACQPTAAPVQQVLPTAAPTATKPPVPTKAPTTAALVPATGSDATVSVAQVNAAKDPQYGDILVDAKGMTLYIFTKDAPGKSNCTGECLVKWPPLLTSGTPKAGTGVDQAMLGTAKLADGTMIVTYKDMPLYYWVNDKKPGDATGQNVGSVWFVIAPDGKIIDKTPGAASSTGSEATVGVAQVNVAKDPQYGDILVDAKGMTLYIFTKDEPGKSNCTGECLVKWPPLLTSDTPKAGTGVDQAMLGTAKLADGSLIVTFNKMPLYYWVNDKKPGDATGQNVGSVWFVIAPDGKIIDKTPGAASSSGSDTNSPKISDDVKLRVATDPKLGKIIVDQNGMTLYMFTKDGPNKSNCAGGCLAAWPPFLDNGKVKAEDGVNAALIGSTSLPDGSKIVTYNKMPLYYWAGDTKPGDTSGQGVNSVWYVVSPEGKVIGQ